MFCLVEFFGEIFVTFEKYKFAILCVIGSFSYALFKELKYLHNVGQTHAVEQWIVYQGKEFQNAAKVKDSDTQQFLIMSPVSPVVYTIESVRLPVKLSETLHHLFILQQQPKIIKV